jgi:hypothetical protein
VANTNTNVLASTFRTSLCFRSRMGGVWSTRCRRRSISSRTSRHSSYSLSTSAERFTAMNAVNRSGKEYGNSSRSYISCTIYLVRSLRGPLCRYGTVVLRLDHAADSACRDFGGQDCCRQVFSILCCSCKVMSSYLWFRRVRAHLSHRCCKDGSGCLDERTPCLRGHSKNRYIGFHRCASDSTQSKVVD